MPSRISENIKSAVIEQWLVGDQRDKIAVNNSLSAGAVTNIVNEWHQNLGIPLAKDLRELAITLRRSGLSPNRCARGHRIAMILTKLGVKDEDFDSFVSQIYNDSKRIMELPTEKIASHLTDLVKISRNMSPSEVKSDIEQKINQKRTLEEQIENLSAQIERLEKQKSDIKEQYDTALKKERMTAASLSWYSDLRVELVKYQIQVDDIQLFVQTIRNIQQYDYNVKEVISEFSDLKLLNDKKRGFSIAVKELEDKAGILRRDCSVLEQLVTSYNQKLSLYYELEAMGLGLKELKLLWHTVREIAEANNIPLDQASQKFYKDIEEQYDDMLGLELKINELRSEISTVSINLKASRTALLAQPLVASSLQRLFSKGVVEQDIVELANLFDRSYNDSTDKSNIDIQSLLTELEKYRGIKSTVQELNQQVGRLRNEISALQKQKQGLEEQNQKILSILVDSKQIVEFLHASDDSLNDDNLKILTTIAFILHILYIRYEGPEILADGDLSEFRSLARAAAKDKADSVSVPELKIAVAKSLKLLTHKLDTKSEAN